MKMKELTERLENLGVNWQRDTDTIALYDDNLRTLIEISEEEAYCLEVFEMFHYLKDRRKRVLYNLATGYASTPLEERSEPKRYIYKMTKAVTAQMYLTAKAGGTVKFAPSPYEDIESGFKGELTDKEVASFPEEVQALFDACIKEEVQ